MAPLKGSPWFSIPSITITLSLSPQPLPWQRQRSALNAPSSIAVWLEPSSPYSPPFTHLPILPSFYSIFFALYPKLRPLTSLPVSPSIMPSGSFPFYRFRVNPTLTLIPPSISLPLSLSPSVPRLLPLLLLPFRRALCVGRAHGGDGGRSASGRRGLQRRGRGGQPVLLVPPARQVC